MATRERPGRLVSQVKLFQAGNLTEPEKTRVQQPRKVKRNPALFDAHGVHIASGLDLCDCIDPGCPGCHFDCECCGSPKCGAECRRNRRTFFLSRKDDLTNEVIHSPAVEVQRPKENPTTLGNVRVS